MSAAEMLTVLVPLRLPVTARSPRELRQHLLQPISPAAVIVGIQPAEVAGRWCAIVELPDQLELDLTTAA